MIQIGEREIGSGSVIAGLAAVAVRALGLPRERIRVEYQSTAEAPFDSGVFGSRTVAVLGRAIEAAAAEARATLAERLGAPGPAILSVEGNRIQVRAGDVRRPLIDLLTPDERGAGALVVVGKHYGRSGAIDERLVRDGTFHGYTDFTGAVHVAEVAVDRATGGIRVVRCAAFQDVGTLLDPSAARAQVEGGVAMGLGTALTEEAIWSEDGRLLNPGLLDYRIPTLGEVPPIEVEFVEGFLGAGPYGAKGLGEPPIVPVPAAVAIALREACGAHTTELPMTAERTARALKLL
ncbi:aldehyde oxidase and xanthine dehydrogenase, molybdopterin binding protein [mine drainage metagenome]|uniref:Aldehyde oxidase and xanthine dehydrogenase, molybdopterin binding protein n=1 Tax=mine drainage metagenome TaxID=410659 RepID=T1C1S5_9ZZZZ